MFASNSRSPDLKVHPILKVKPAISISIRLIHHFSNGSTGDIHALSFIEICLKLRSLDSPTTVCIYLSEHLILGLDLFSYSCLTNCPKATERTKFDISWTRVIGWDLEVIKKAFKLFLGHGFDSHIWYLT